MILQWIHLNIYVLFFFAVQPAKPNLKKDIVIIADTVTATYQLKVYFTSDNRDSIGVDFNYLGKQFLCRDEELYDYFISDHNVVINNLFDVHIIAQKVRTKNYSAKFEIPDTITGFSFTTNLYDYNEFFSLAQNLNLIEGVVHKDHSFCHSQDNDELYKQAKKISIFIALDKIKSNTPEIVDLRVVNRLL